MRLAAGVAEGLAQFLDGLGHRTDRGGLMAPDRVEQIVAAYHGRCLFDQMTEHGEGLRAQVDRTVRSIDLFLLQIRARNDQI